MPDFQELLQAALGDACRIERELALGGLGRAFMSVEVATGRRVTVQALPPDMAERLDPARFREATDRVRHLHHPGIMPMLAAEATPGIAWCVWPHPRGESLRYRLVRDGGLGPEESLQVLHDVADALAYAHAHGIQHGDIRPDTIYLDRNRAVIAELGIRSAIAAALGAGETLDPRADVHALAVAGQQMLGGRGAAVAAVLTRALSIDPSEQYAGAAALRDALGTPPSTRRRWRLRRRSAAVVLVAAVIAGIVFHQAGRNPALDPDLVAVAPFEVLDAGHRMWSEGLMTVLASNLDGAGPLRTVSPAVVLRHWRGPPGMETLARLARQTGSRLALAGHVEPMGLDTMRLSATLVDVGADPPTRTQIQLLDAAGRMDRLADSLTVRVLRHIGRSRPLTAVRSASLGASSLPALKAFLEGEQHFRRTEWDSAIAAYERAIELDSGFALALYRAGVVLGWQSTSSDSLSLAYLLRAASHNHGLPPRDSFLVLAESLSAALDEGPVNPRYWEQYRRLYSATRLAAERYPNDPEVWYEYADVRYHYPRFSSEPEMRQAFDRSIALDSSYAPAYIHPVELANQLGDPDGARRYLERYLALEPKDTYADAARLTQLLLDPAQARSPEVAAVLDTASVELLQATVQSFRGWDDTLETAVRLARRMVASGGTLPTQHGRTSPYLPELGSALDYHGRIAEAWARAGPSIGWLFVATAWLGGVPRDTAAVIMRWSLNHQPLFPRAMAVLGAPWWAEQGDSTSLASLARRADSLARTGSTAVEQAFGRFAADGARALGALARGDTAAAIRGLLALPDTVCERCALYTVELARLLDARRMDTEAARLLAQDSPGYAFPTDGFWELYRARLFTRRGERVSAARSYRFVRDVWAHADPSFQPYRREAMEALARLRQR